MDPSLTAYALQLPDASTLAQEMKGEKTEINLICFASRSFLKCYSPVFLLRIAHMHFLCLSSSLSVSLPLSMSLSVSVSVSLFVSISFRFYLTLSPFLSLPSLFLSPSLIFARFYFSLFPFSYLLVIDPERLRAARGHVKKGLANALKSGI